MPTSPPSAPGSTPASASTFDDYITATLMRDLVGHDRSPVSFLVYLWLSAEQQRRHAPVQISYQELAESIGISKSAAQTAVAWLVRRKLLSAAKANATAVPTYSALTPWVRSTSRPQKSASPRHK